MSEKAYHFLVWQGFRTHMTYDTEKRNDWALNQQADVSI